ncbi:siphovirus ReqiPepy6 Gp37-like family protein [Streptomyces sp. NPDC059874]|uniref:siphovirus ReqiPepy6 Gp37-like family protein n=1 Tax=Streptomyces sp. NPDC059874 TaxID=3346983 RepID=UPI0036673695
MKMTDLTVEVRNKQLERLGVIRPEELVLELEDAFNNVGTWKVTLAAEHPLADELRLPGSGLIITGTTDVLMSGPTTANEYAATPEDPGGSIVFSGISDTSILLDYLAYPQPSNVDPTSQTESHDVRTGKAESVMHAYVKANAGADAPVSRRKPRLTTGADLSRGPTVTKSARFPVLGTLISELALLADLGFRIVQRDGDLVFETYAVTDRTAYIRLDVQNNSLSGSRVSIGAPGATRVIVAGQGEMVKRNFREVTTVESLAVESEWGRRIEVFQDQRNTNDDKELDQSGLELLAEQGFTAIGVQAVPAEDSSMEFGKDWGMGDRVSVVVDDHELTSTVTGMVLKADSEGFRLGALLGTTTGFSADAKTNQRVQNTEKRISELERNGSAGGDEIMQIMKVW